MKATLEFNLPEDRSSYQCAYFALETYGALNEVDKELRSLVKHGSPNDESRLCAERCRHIIGEILAKIEQ